MQFALTLSPEIHAVHVGTEEETNALQDNWNRLVAEPVVRAGGTPPNLVNLASPYRLIIKPILDYVLDMEVEKSGPANRGDRAGAGRAALVPLPAAQPARGIAEGAAAGEGQPQHRADQRAVVHQGLTLVRWNETFRRMQTQTKKN